MILVATVVVVRGKFNRNLDVRFAEFHKADLNPFTENIQYFQPRRPFRSYFLQNETPSFKTRRSPWDQVSSFAYQKLYFAAPPTSFTKEQIILEEPPLSFNLKTSIDQFSPNWVIDEPTIILEPPNIIRDQQPIIYGEPPAIPIQQAPENGQSLPCPKPSLPFRGPWGNSQKHLSSFPEHLNDLNSG